MLINLTKMKTLLCTLTIGLTFLFSTAAVYADELTYITNDNVNFRVSASLDANIFKTLTAGTKLTVESFDENGWSLVTYGDQQGYIKSEFLTGQSQYIEDKNSDIELLQWEQAKKIFDTYTPAKVYDVRTRLVYYVQSFSNGKHADVETLTQGDTNILLSTYGGSWKWDPRPVFVTINGRTMAASINGMPHGSGTIANNGMNGQVCIHFQGSTTHNGNITFANDHQKAVMQAWNAR